MQHRSIKKHWKQRLQKNTSNNETRGAVIEQSANYWSVIVSAVGVSASLLAAFCYSLGRASLIGWYSAAGVPLLTFSWPIQDVMVRGFMALDKWAILVAIVVLPIVMHALLLSSTHQIRELLIRNSRGSRLLAPASQQNQTKNDKPRPPLLRQADFYLGLAVPICLTFIIYIAIVALLVEVYNEGKESFRREFALATNNELTQPITHSASTTTRDSHNATPSDKPKHVAREMGYAYVRVAPQIGNEAQGANSGYCGWLIQASDKQVLLLQDSGVTLLNYSDQPFRWSPVKLNECKEGT